MQKQSQNVRVRFNLLTNLLMSFFLFVILLHISESKKTPYNLYNSNNYNNLHYSYNYNYYTPINNKVHTNKTNTNKTKTNKTKRDKTKTLFFLLLHSKNSKEKWKRKENINSVLQLGSKKKNQKEIKRRKNYQYAMKHMFDKNGRRIKEINKERKSLKKKKIFDYEGFKVDKIFTCLSEEEMEELRDEELKRKSGEILYNNKYIDTYGVESDGDMEGL